MRRPVLLSVAVLLAACGGAAQKPPPTSIERINAEGLRRLERGDDAGAEDAFRDALKEAELVDDLVGEAEAWNNLGALAMARGRAKDAWAYHAAALRLHAASGVRDSGEVRTRTNLGGAMLASGATGPAKEQFEEAIRLAAAIHDERSGLLARVGLVSARLSDGAPAAIAREADDVVRSAHALAEDGAEAAALAVEGTALELAGDLAGARARFEAALAIDRRREQPAAVESDLHALARVVEKTPDRGLAASLLARASRVARRLGQLDVAERDLRRAIDLAGDPSAVAAFRVELDALVEARHRAGSSPAPSGAAAAHPVGIE